MKNPMQGRQEKNDPCSGNLELHHPKQQNKYQIVSNNIYRQNVLNTKPFGKHAPYYRTGHTKG